MQLIIAFCRFALPFFALVIITKCLLTLLLGHPVNKTYGYIVDADSGERLTLNTWETSLGRSNSCDLTLPYDTVSRFQAVISRRLDGWYVFDTRSKSGTKVNGSAINGREIITDGDRITFGDRDYRFVIADDPVQQVGKRRAKKTNERLQARPGKVDNHTSSQQYPSQTNTAGTPAAFSGTPPRPIHPKPDFTGHPAARTSAPDFANDSFELSFDRKSSNAQTAPAATGAKRNIYSDSSPAPTAFSGTRSKAEPALINIDTGEVFVLCGNTVTIGRGRGADISIFDSSVSRRHATLKLFEDGWAVSDDGSSLGTLLNSKRVSSPLLLFNNDIIAIGEHRFRYTSNRHKA